MRMSIVAVVALVFAAGPSLASAQEQQLPDNAARGAGANAAHNRPDDAATGARSGDPTNNRNPAAPRNAARKVNPQDVHATGGAHLSQESAAKIATALNATATPKDIHVTLTVGGLLPGDVDLEPLPPAVVEIVPEYQGYEYVVVNDDIVIVQPSTRKVVEVISEGEGPHAMNDTTSKAGTGTRVSS